VLNAHDEANGEQAGKHLVHHGPLKRPVQDALQGDLWPSRALFLQHGQGVWVLLGINLGELLDLSPTLLWEVFLLLFFIFI
jgi:hypothetical protein